MTLDRAVFIVSLDFELIWGRLDTVGPDGARAACERERADVFGPLVQLFEQFEIEATWCVLGHLMLDACAPVAGRKHPEIVRPTHGWQDGDWFQHDPCGDEATFPVFYGRSLVERLLECPIPQEIGCHSFSHVIFGDPGCSKETARTEVGACVETARELGVTLRSFAFPRNSVGHLDVLRDHGITCFRGPEPSWHGGGSRRQSLWRAGHLAEVLAARRPPAVVPEMEQGLVNIPASMVYFPMHGRRRHIPMTARLRRINRGIDAAVRQRRVFHLWFHPTNLAYETERMLDGLASVLERVATSRDNGDLEVLPMRELAERTIQASPKVG